MSNRTARLEELREITGHKSVEELERCTDLGFYRENLTCVPLGVWDLTGLEWLAVGDNQLSSLPPEISRLTGLTYLDIERNPIEELPPQITALTLLKNLWIQDDKGKVNIKYAPRGITNLPCYKNTSDTFGGLSIAAALKKLQLYDPVDATEKAHEG